MAYTVFALSHSWSEDDLSPLSSIFTVMLHLLLWVFGTPLTQGSQVPAYLIFAQQGRSIFYLEALCLQIGCHPSCSLPELVISLFQPPWNALGGSRVMSLKPSSWARQPARVAWSMEHLIVEHSITLGCTLDHSTQSVYSSGLNSYLAFCQFHHLDTDPTVNTL